MQLRAATDADSPLLAQWSREPVEDERADDAPLAYALLSPGESGVGPRRVLVSREQRRRGLGCEAMRLLRERCAPADASFSLEVLVHDERALGRLEHATRLRMP